MSRKYVLPFLASLALSAAIADSAQAYVRVGNCDKVAHQVDLELAGEPQTITLQPGQHYTTFARPVRLSMNGQRPEGLITTRQARDLDEYCIWNGKLQFQRRRTALYRH